jgi:hypothetical protein
VLTGSQISNKPRVSCIKLWRTQVVHRSHLGVHAQRSTDISLQIIWVGSELYVTEILPEYSALCLATLINIAFQTFICVTTSDHCSGSLCSILSCEYPIYYFSVILLVMYIWAVALFVSYK